MTDITEEQLHDETIPAFIDCSGHFFVRRSDGDFDLVLPSGLQGSTWTPEELGTKDLSPYYGSIPGYRDIGIANPDDASWSHQPQDLDGLGFEVETVSKAEHERLLNTYQRVAAQEATVRGAVLHEAAGLITGDRNKTYGSPTANFTNTAAMWTVYLNAKFGININLDPSDVSACQVLLKVARMVAQPKWDNWTDIAGYAGCGAEADVETGRIPADG